MNKWRDLPPPMKEGQTNGGFFLHLSFYLQFSLVWNRSLQCSEDKSRSDHKQNARRSLAELRPGRCLTLQHKQSLQQGESLFLSLPCISFLISRCCSSVSISVSDSRGGLGWVRGWMLCSWHRNRADILEEESARKHVTEQEVPHEEIYQ